VKRKILGSILGIICLAMVSIADAQQSSDMPAAVCQALEHYVAQINSTVAVSEKPARQEHYTVALSALTPVLKQYKKDQLLAQAAEYAQYCELVTAADPTNPKLGELLDKKLKLGAALQGLCLPSPSSR
jgi:hypothetical protein